MTALSDRANMIEHQRQRLHDGITDEWRLYKRHITEWEEIEWTST